MWYFLLAAWALCLEICANYPVFESANQLKQLFIPADVLLGSVIYRLRATDTDYDYPLHFEATDYGSYVVKVENLPCDKNSTRCEANVYLERVLSPHQTFQFRFTVRDTKGDTTTATTFMHITDTGTKMADIFLHVPRIIVVPEDKKPGAELEYVTVKRNQESVNPTSLEIWGCPEIAIGRFKSTKDSLTGVVTLQAPLDFEVRNMYKLQVFALDMYTNRMYDSRNIAGFDLILIVEDVQDTPPIFVNIPLMNVLPNNLTVGDFVTYVMAIDGDRGNPRQIKYGLVSEGNPFTIFFNIDVKTGNITLAKPLKDLVSISSTNQPIYLTIVAEEEQKDMAILSASTTATLTLIISDAGYSSPYFDNNQYFCHLIENSPQGTALIFDDSYSAQVQDDDRGKRGVFSLSLEQNNGTFEISPSVVERKSNFVIRVRDKQMLDYEQFKSLHFLIVAKELDTSSGKALSATATVVVFLTDNNDNAPYFEAEAYEGILAENATANTVVTTVKALDKDAGAAGSVHYTRISGFKNSSLCLNPVTGVVTVATDHHTFDREETSEYRLLVEARDMEGNGLLATVPLIIRILDVNDESPIFENVPIQFTLSSDLNNFSSRAFIKVIQKSGFLFNKNIEFGFRKGALDKDAEPPNNIVRYEIISGNYDDKFILNPDSGELTVRQSSKRSIIKRQISETYGTIPTNYDLTVRAYDMGIPHHSATTHVKIYPPEAGVRILTFILPGSQLDYRETENVLAQLTAARVTILDIKPYRGGVGPLARDLSRNSPDKNKSVVTARVSYNKNAVYDVEEMYYNLKSVLDTSRQSDQVVYEAASNENLLFWIFLLLFLLFILLILTFLFCCVCKGCILHDTLYGYEKSRKISNSKTIKNKGVQVVNGGNGVWTTTTTGAPTKPTRVQHFLVKSPREEEAVGTTGESFVFQSRDIARVEKRGADIYVQEIADSEYRVLDPMKLKSGEDVLPARRREMFCREGDAEILRLKSTREGGRNDCPGYVKSRDYENGFVQDGKVDPVGNGNCFERNGVLESWRFRRHMTPSEEAGIMALKETFQTGFPRDFHLQHERSPLKMESQPLERENETLLRRKRSLEYLGRVERDVNSLDGNSVINDSVVSPDEDRVVRDFLEKCEDSSERDPKEEEMMEITARTRSDVKTNENFMEFDQKAGEETNDVEKSVLVGKRVEILGDDDDVIMGEGVKMEEIGDVSSMEEMPVMETAKMDSRSPDVYYVTFPENLTKSLEVEFKSPEFEDIGKPCLKRQPRMVLSEVEDDSEKEQKSVSAAIEEILENTKVDVGKNETADEFHFAGQEDIWKQPITEMKMLKQSQSEAEVSDNHVNWKKVRKQWRSADAGIDEILTLNSDVQGEMDGKENIVMEDIEENKRAKRDLSAELTLNSDIQGEMDGKENSVMEDIEENKRVERDLSTEMETLSLPGSFHTGTQTDRHRATQTDVLCLLRPEPRKAKSETEESSEDEKLRKRPVGSPILEEEEHKFSREEETTMKVPVDKKEAYMTKALKARLAARRNSASDVAMEEGAEKAERKPRYMEWYKKRQEDRKTIKVREVRKGNSSNRNDGKVEREDGKKENEAATSLVVGSLKLKTKNQQLMEKKSVFAIAYDDANTEHISSSSNGSHPE